MGDLLKEAIADAKAVRETALANAKMALEEAFTPQLKSMLTAKLKEDEFEDEEEFPAEQEDEFGGEEEIPAEEGDYYEDDEIPGEEEVPLAAHGIPGEEVPLAAQDEIPGEEEVIEINGVKYAPVAEQDEIPGEEVPGEDELDLEAVIRQLETEIKEGEDEEETVDEGEDEEETVDEENLGNKNPEAKDNAYSEQGEADIKEITFNGKAYRMLEQDEEEYEVDEALFSEGPEDADNAHSESDPGEKPEHVGGTIGEQSDSSDIGTGDNKVDVADGDDEEDPEGGAGTKVEPMGEAKRLRNRLKEYREAVTFLKNKLHEVNILNAKLLFTNKLFKGFALDNNQKLRVVETFDRAQSTREIKLVYSTLAEQFGDNGSITRKHSIKESASAKAGSTKPRSKKIITEESNVVNRFKQLAGIIK